MFKYRIFCCKHCGWYFFERYWIWVLRSPFHTFTKRLTKCPRCNKKSWMKPIKK